MSGAVRQAASPFAALLGEQLDRLPEVGHSTVVLSGKPVVRRNEIAARLGFSKGPAYDALVETLVQARLRHRREYMQRYRAANHDRLAEQRRALIESNAEHCKALARASNQRWYHQHREQIYARRRADWAAKKAAKAAAALAPLDAVEPITPPPKG